MAAADGGLFDSTDDEEEFLGFREEDIPVSVDENDKDLSGDSRGFNSSRVAGRSTGWQITRLEPSHERQVRPGNFISDANSCQKL